ncbi:MAG: acylphosphatase [Deltaproteobacteria bacterium]|nr:acylphosphatase [Deltaproteobacteria bacterium]
MKKVHVYISGRVQGVFFRAETQRAAVCLQLTGWVRNTEDGSVEAVFEGEDRDIDKMLAWCQTGPPHARVDQVIVEEEPFTGDYPNFKIAF